MPSTNTATMIAFTFPKVEDNGLIVDPSGTVAYQLYTRSDMPNSPTVVSRANGQPVGELAWKGMTHGQTVTLYGTRTNSLVTRRKGKMFKGAEWVFHDAAGNEYAWDKLSVSRIAFGRVLIEVVTVGFFAVSDLGWTACRPVLRGGAASYAERQVSRISIRSYAVGHMLIRARP